MSGFHRTRAAVISILLSAALLASCGSTDETPSAPRPDAETISLDKRQKLADAADDRLVKAVNEFGMKLHRELAAAETDGNVLISPYSISMALGMTYFGSAGNTRTEMAETLGLGRLAEEEIAGGYRSLGELLTRTGKGVALLAANSLWTQEGIKLPDDYMKIVRNSFNAEARSVNFTDDAAPQRINDWIEESTRGMIDKLVDRVDPDMRIMLINAIYFKGQWQKPFDPEETREERFRQEDGTTANVQMMHRTGYMEYRATDRWQAVRIPYGEGQMAMLVIVPDESADLASLHEQLWTDRSAWSGPMEHHQVKLGLPKFKADFEEKLNGTLIALGMKDAFDPAQADFSGFGEADKEGLYIDEVKHKSVIEVNEQGTEAAAATSVGVASGAPQETVSLTVDRPFFFAIEDMQTGAWLFAGSIREIEGK